MLEETSLPFFGKIKKDLFRKACQGREEDKVRKEIIQNLRWWERRLQLLRKQLDDLQGAVCHDVLDSQPEEKPSLMSQLAKEVRVMDEGVVKGGEPDVFFPDNDKESLKRFLLKKRRTP